VRHRPEQRKHLSFFDPSKGQEWMTAFLDQNQCSNTVNLIPILFERIFWRAAGAIFHLTQGQAQSYIRLLKAH